MSPDKIYGLITHPMVLYRHEGRPGPKQHNLFTNTRLTEYCVWYAENGVSYSAIEAYGPFLKMSCANYSCMYSTV